MTDTVYESHLASLELVARGKVRDIYRVDDEHLLIVTSDRLSAFDVILPDPIPGKGAVLTALSNFWFERFTEVIPNHLTGIDPASVVTGAADRAQVAGRATVVRRLSPLPVEAIVRGYLIGSGWNDYRQSGTVCGIRLPPGLAQADRLPEPVFTPSTKATIGGHDENITFADAAALLGDDVASKVRAAAVEIYGAAAEYARTRGIIIADTKFEFGLDAAGTVTLIDEVLTPDSSRFWPEDAYRTGVSPPSYDKQYVRDYLESLGWSKTPPAPRLPREVIAQTAAKYREALTRLTAAG